MFKNNEVFDFEAKYGQDVEQSSKELNDGWETSLKYDVSICFYFIRGTNRAAGTIELESYDREPYCL